MREDNCEIMSAMYRDRICNKETFGEWAQILGSVFYHHMETMEGMQMILTNNVVNEHDVSSLERMDG